MNQLVFETVGDVNSTYAYLCVYFSGNMTDPFMEISITESRELQFVIYAIPKKNITLTASHWSEIQNKAEEFLPLALANEDASS